MRIMSHQNPMNPAAIERLCKLGGDAFTIRIIDMFINYCGEKVVNARQALVAGNMAAVADSAHPVKSSAGNVGAVRLQEFAASLEEVARQGNRERVNDLLPKFEAAFAEAKIQLEDVRAKLKSPPI